MKTSVTIEFTIEIPLNDNWSPTLSVEEISQKAKDLAITMLTNRIGTSGGVRVIGSKAKLVMIDE